jgi:hypothetical protein
VLEVRLHDGTLLAFDGRVLEVFDVTHGSRRFHVDCIPPPRLDGPDGTQQLTVGEPPVVLGVAHEDAPACARLIAAVERAREGTA